jgi:hypothetical protein
VFFPGARVSEEAKACEQKAENCEVEVEGRGGDDAAEKQIDDEQVLDDISEHVVADADDQVDRQAEDGRQQKQHKHEPRAKRTELSSRSIKRATVESIKRVAGAAITKMLITTMPCVTLTRHQAPTASTALS